MNKRKTMKTTTKILAAAALSAAVCASQAATLRVATEAAFAPFEYVNSETHELEGFDLDLIRLLAKKAGYDTEITAMGFDAIIPGILTGTIDVGAAGFTITPERAKRVLFTKPYYDSGLSILVRKEDKNVIRSEKDLEGQKICVQIGTSGAIYAGKVKGAKVTSYNALPDAYLELKNKGCRAVVADKPVTGYFMATKGDSDGSYYHLPLTLTAEQFGFCLSKKNPKLTKALDKALEDAKASGEYRALYEKYFGK